MLFKRRKTSLIVLVCSIAFVLRFMATSQSHLMSVLPMTLWLQEKMLSASLRLFSSPLKFWRHFLSPSITTISRLSAPGVTPSLLLKWSDAMDHFFPGLPVYYRMLVLTNFKPRTHNLHHVTMYEHAIIYLLLIVACVSGLESRKHWRLKLSKFSSLLVLKHSKWQSTPLTMLKRTTLQTHDEETHGFRNASTGIQNFFRNHFVLISWSKNRKRDWLMIKPWVVHGGC